ncbi:MAG TPA: Fic family protein [Candidatus Dormibacteraeota bacterium]|nr:Fic family protein [Candidatus Dormibacteraeota bacterium]
MSAGCPDWSQPESDSQLPSVTVGTREVSRFIVKRAVSLIINQGTLRNWHSELFKSVVPLSYYAGNFRCDDPSRPCLGRGVQIGNYAGSDYHIVETEMAAYSANLYSYIQKSDSYLAVQASFANKVTASLQLASWAVGRFVQIHPFLNGNGRISRLLSNYFFVRYGLGLVPFKTIIRPGGDYTAAMDRSMMGDFVPLFQYFVLLLADSSVR